MAGKFPIKYSTALPSGKSPAVTANIDVRTGAQEIGQAYARLGAGVAEIGSHLVGESIRIQRQEDSAELSELKRKVDEQGYALFNATTGDEEADANLWMKFEEDLGKIQSKRGNVNTALQKHINSVLPSWKDVFDKKGLAVRRKNVKDKFELEGENLLAQGNLAEYYKQLHTRLALKDISQAEFDFKVANAPNDSILQQMRLHIGNGNPQLAIELSTKMEGASADQMEFRDKLTKRASKDLQTNTDTAITKVVLEKDKLKNATYAEKNQALPQLKQTLIDGGVVGDDLQKWFGILDKWADETRDVTEEYNPQVYSKISAIVDLAPESLTEAQIYRLVEIGKEGGITTNQAQELVKRRKINIDEIGSVNAEIHRRYQGILKRMHEQEQMFGKGKIGAVEYAETANKLTVYANANKDATPKEFESFFAELINEKMRKSWLKIAYKQGLRAIRGTRNLLLMPTKLRDIQSEVKTALPVRNVGETVEVKGRKWQLVTLGETPDKDIWAKVE